MYDLRAVTDFASRGAELYRHYVPAEWSPYPTLAAGAAVLLGFVLAFWGARLLRTIYVLAFMVGGAAVGFQVGRYLQIDPLIGLTFGGGIAGIVGYLFFRWWVGLTAGAFAVLLVLGMALPRIQEVEQEYRDHAVGVGTGSYADVLTEGTDLQTPAIYLSGLVRYVMQERRDFGMRLALAGGLAVLLGIVAGLFLPRFTVILGTSVVGVLLLAVGIGVLMWRIAPELWGRVAAHPEWFLIAWAVVLLVAFGKQSRLVRAKAPTPAASPSPPQSPPAPATK